MPGHYPNINLEDVLVGCPWRLENGWETPIIPLLISAGKTWCTFFFGGGGNWIAGSRDFKSMEIQRLPSRLAAEMQRLEVTLLGGTLEPPRWRVGIVGFQGAKIPSKPLKTNISPENGWLEDEICF